MPSAPTSLTTIASRRLRVELLTRRRRSRPRPSRRRTRRAPGRGGAGPTACRARRSSARAPARGRWARVLLELGRGRRARPEVRDGRRHQQHVGGVKARLACVQQLGRGLHGDDADAGRRRQRDVGGDDRHVGAAAGGRRGQRQSHPARRTVADVPDGVDRLTRAAGGDEHPDAGPAACWPPAPAAARTRRPVPRARTSGRFRARRARRARRCWARPSGSPARAAA